MESLTEPIEKSYLMDNITDYITRITRLASRNNQLDTQLKQLVSRYESIQDQNNRYQDLMKEFAPDEGAKVGVGRREIQRYPMVSLMFVSVRGFHKLAGHPKAVELIDLLDELHMTLQIICKKYKIVRVRTIGDSFLFASGMPEENHTNPIDVMDAAREMIEAVRLSSFSLNNGNPFWELSIGIHTGPVTAEHTGKKNTPYSLTGESVNIAYRVGRISKAGSISLSVMTGEMIKEFYETDHWGSLPVKYKGCIDVFYLKGIIPELSVDGLGNTPNDMFRIKYGLIQFMDIQEALLDRLEQHLPANLYYHNVKHTIDVVTEVELIGWAEGVNDEELLMLKLAALFHDSGHIVSYQNHEFYGTQIATDMLSSYSNYTPENIETICRLIMATKMPPSPQDTLESVMCDSDLDYLGRADFIPVSNSLYQELKEREMIDSFDNWNRMQLKFINKHQYFTETARSLREVNKKSQIERLTKLLEHDPVFLAELQKHSVEIPKG